MNLPPPSPSLHAFLADYGCAVFCGSMGGHAPFPRAREVEGCTVSVYKRFPHKRDTVTVSASDGDCVITFDAGRAVVVERASNLGSATALGLARRIADYINAM